MSDTTVKKAWDPEWENIHRAEQWGRYPSEHLVRFMARNYYNAPDRSQVKALEIGCGQGAQVWYMAREGFSVYGIDGSETAIEEARNLLARDGLQAELRVGDVIQLDFPDAFFDVVLDIECLMGNDWDGASAIIGEVIRVLKPGGRFFSQTFTDKTHVGTQQEKIGPNTYRNISDGQLARKRLLRLTGEEEIPRLYEGFSDIAYEVTRISYGGRLYFDEEWLITCTK